MAGIDGNVDTLLTDENLLIERRDGKGMRITLDSIVRLRHHSVAITPPLVTFIGLILIIASWRVLSGQAQIYALLAGSTSLLAWALGRRPALCIDTNQGDRHILFGRDHRLQRLHILLDRMSDGMTLEEARIGLMELESQTQLELGSMNDFRVEAGAAAEATASLSLTTDSEESLSDALAAIRSGREKINSSPSMNLTPSTPEPTTPSIPENAFDTGSPMFDRATKALEGQRQDNVVGKTTYDLPFQSPSTSNNNPSENTYEQVWERPSPNRYEESPPMSRAEAAAKSASESTFDTGGMFGMFDALDSITEKPGTSVTTLPEPVNSVPMAQLPESATSSFQMLSAAAGPNLPEPTREALRTDLPSGPGLVANARIKEPENPPLPENLQQSFTKIQTPDPIDKYPMFKRLLVQQQRDARLRVDSRRRRGRGALRALGELVRPGIKRLEESGKRIGSAIRGAGDGYREVYGDQDGLEGDLFVESEMLSGQILRLRADQDAQADVQERLRLLTKNGGGAIADDLASRTLRGISSGSERGAPSLSGSETAKLNGPSTFTGMVSSTEPVARIAGLKRLG